MSDLQFTLTDEEREIIQILITHHKWIYFSSTNGWCIDMTIEDDAVHFIIIDYSLVQNLSKKNLLKRELTPVGSGVYKLNENPNYKSILDELRVQKALGVLKESKNISVKIIKRK